jgi:prepilin-type N-terminal cleavage/methylation domain-containing protein
MKNRPTTRTRSGFTLIELTIVISVIVLAMAISLPTLITSFRAGADKQSENILSSLCTAARVTAVRDGKYTLVHHQLSVATTVNDLTTRHSYLAICTGTKGVNGTMFRLTPGFDPQRLPGDMCLGAVSRNTVSNSGTGASYNSNVINAVSGGNPNPDPFTSFSIVFSPAGRVVTQIDGIEDVRFDITDPAFRNTDANTYLWDPAVANGNNAQGVSAVTLFSYGQYVARPSSGAGPTKFNYIDENGDFLPVNVYTGQLFLRK